MHLSTPALFAPYVRLELLRWDPLYADPLYADGDLGGPASASASASGINGGTGLPPPPSAAAPREGVHRGFDQQLWYETLFDYGVGSDLSAPAMAEDDPDMELVPQLVRKLVLPIALSMIER